MLLWSYHSIWCHNSTVWHHNGSIMTTWNRKYTWLPCIQQEILFEALIIILLIKQHFSFLEIPFILTWALNDRYRPFNWAYLTWHILEASMKLAMCNGVPRCLACAWGRLHVTRNNITLKVTHRMGLYLVTYNQTQHHWYCDLSSGCVTFN